MHWEEITMKSFSNRKWKSIFSISFVFFTLFFLNAKSLIAEANQIMKFNDVDELVAYFKGILPYAVALGVKNEAIKLMQKAIKLYNFDESTYYDINRRVYYNSYNNHFMANEISRGYNNAYNKIMEDRFKDMKSANGGSGGFGGGGFSSGGGFSGGGSGGGGGGSW